MFLLYHAYIYLELLILTCTIYILAPDQVLLTPHMGWKGLETRQRLVSILADNIKQFMEGNPINVVSGL